jgi:hypothetical protein
VRQSRSLWALSTTNSEKGRENARRS